MLEIDYWMVAIETKFVEVARVAEKLVVLEAEIKKSDQGLQVAKLAEQTGQGRLDLAQEEEMIQDADNQG